MDPAPGAHLDWDRESRTGIPEIVLAEGKADADLADIVREFHGRRGRVLVSRLAPDRLHVLDDVPHHYHEAARLAVVGDEAPQPTGGRVGVIAAGTSDRPVAEEAAVVAREMGCETRVVLDVGAAGIHRLYPHLEWARAQDVVIVAAGREGTLPTVVAGLVDAPVIGVPVSVGYGHGGRGEAALGSMLQSCAPLLVVNIDAGVVAGATAANIANRVARARRSADAREQGEEVPARDAA